MSTNLVDFEKRKNQIKSSIFLISKLTSMEVGAAETGREGGKWEKKKKQQRRTREREREKRKIHSFVGGMKRSLSRGIIHTLFHSFIQRSRSVSRSGSAGRSRARARARSLVSRPLSACDDGFACCLGLCLPPLAPKSFTAVSNEAMI